MHHWMMPILPSLTNEQFTRKSIEMKAQYNSRNYNHYLEDPAIRSQLFDVSNNHQIPLEVIRDIGYRIANHIDYYGSFLAIQDKFKMNITDDFEYLHDSNYFLENLNKHFSITKHDFLSQFMSNNSRRNRNKLNISNTNIKLGRENYCLC